MTTSVGSSGMTSAHHSTAAGSRAAGVSAPRGDLAGSGYCLANPSKEYLVYLPVSGEVTVDLSAASGAIAVQWLDPVEGTITPGESVEGGAKCAFKSPLNGDAVLYLKVRTAVEEKKRG